MLTTRALRARVAGAIVLAAAVGVLVGSGFPRESAPAIAKSKPVVSDPTEACVRFALAADRAVLRGTRFFPVIVDALELVVDGNLGDVGPVIRDVGDALDRYEVAVDRYRTAREDCIPG